MYSPNAFHAERSSWRAVIYLNLARSVRRILDALDPASFLEDVEPPTPDPEQRPGTALSIRTEEKLAHISELRLRLQPLMLLEDQLNRTLAGDLSGNDLEPTRLGSYAAPHRESGDKKDKEVAVRSGSTWKKALNTFKGKRDDDDDAYTWDDPNDPGHTIFALREDMLGLWRDPFVQDVLHKQRLQLEHTAGLLVSLFIVSARFHRNPALDAVAPVLFGSPPSSLYIRFFSYRPIHSPPGNPTFYLHPPQRNADPQLANSFLNDMERITERRYIPTDDDVLRARLKTLGVVEHHFALDRGAEKGVDWRIYDVGGARGQRHVWAPFFSDVNAIIFLAVRIFLYVRFRLRPDPIILPLYITISHPFHYPNPAPPKQQQQPISAFDQMLAEDRRVNRIEDSIQLFKMMCGNKLLANVNIVLFLNKCDLLKKKLAAGIKVSKYVTSYGDRPNDYEHVSKYFRTKFGAIQRDYSVAPRELYVHLTSVTDTRATSAIIHNVRDIILRQNLKNSSLM
ncbi:Guanine nucleotide-binding protein alpha-4 subunit [Rhizoctonia solani AG-1 IB]|uniref:Guanine nucleotide-binding protein alpha-4 subunit n=1 Tax=Thanatephorus cucumeris (strain AG1-IB / isolate 7/3/14) TaxID=1108050 RepID=M5CBD6_THACB|nr:Guanine nucleotide-binding protein alpha-4 subunit [Rhizoctonia solani AG-1 IB]